MNAAGLALLKNYEGFRDRAYRDMVGKWTIGYGFTEGVKEGDRMTVAEADARLLQELANYRPDCPGTDNQLSAMQCLAWNIGKGAFSASTVLREHKAGHFQQAADAFRMWDRAGGRVVYGLVRRRESERELYLT
jgi:lysozyme